MILISGAGGKTGQAITAVLQRNGLRVRPWLRHAPQAGENSDIFFGDMTSATAWAQALEGVDKVYHICPNMHPDEVAIGQLAVAASRNAGVTHFVYHSVLHPHIRAMPHHWHKLQVEEMVLESSLPFTILQPTAYMQNIRAHWHDIVHAGIFAVPYPVHSRLSLVDLHDVAAVAGQVLLSNKHLGAIYELAGTPPLSQDDVARQISTVVERQVTVKETPLAQWETQARASGLAPFAVETLLAMFRHYARHGLIGNSNILDALLQRPATTLLTCVQRWSQEEVKKDIDA